MEAGTFEVGSIVLTEHRAAQREYSRRHWEKGPWETAPSHGDDSCNASGRRGATGSMPHGPLGEGGDSKHTSGHQAAPGGGRGQRRGTEDISRVFRLDLRA